MAGRASLWDNQLVAGVAFHPRKCTPNTKKTAGGGGWVDDCVAAADGTRIAYRLYVGPPRSQAAETTGRKPAPVLVYFHANAELCTDLESEIGLFYECGFQAVLCPEFRGYGWGAGKPSLTLLCSDAEAVVGEAPRILKDAGLQNVESVPLVVSGRSLGAACAVHIASEFGAERIAGLLVESGCMSLLDLPMVQQLGMMMPDMLEGLRRSPEPLRSYEKLRQVTMPSLFMHGDRDDMIPVEQAVAAHKACASSAKKLVRLRRASHNDLRLVANSEYRAELRLIVDIATGAEPPGALCRSSPPAPGIFGILAKGLRCLPGMRRCLTNEDASGSSSSSEVPSAPSNAA